MPMPHSEQPAEICPTLAFVGHSNSITSLAFSSDGSTLLSGSYDQTVMWDVQSGQIQRLLPTGGLVHSVVFSNDRIAIAWIAYSPEGYYNASPGADRFLRWQIGAELLPLEAYAARFRQPEHIQAVLKS